MLIFDPYTIMPFSSYLAGTGGEQIVYPSLAHFYYLERIAAGDEKYRDYLIQLTDPELFKIEVDGAGLAAGVREDWRAVHSNALKAGIYMQALAHKAFYVECLTNGSSIIIPESPLKALCAEQISSFIADYQNKAGALRIVFTGACDNEQYIENCLNVLFAKKRPVSILSMDGEPCSQGISNYARKIAAPFSIISTTDGIDAAVARIAQRSSHVFMFDAEQQTEATNKLVAALGAAAIKVNQIPRTA